MRRYPSLLPAAGIFCLALLVRVVYNATVAHGYFPLYDAGYYNTIALNLIHGRCYCLVPHHSTLSRAPLWPWLIAIIYTVTGTDNAHARLFLCFVGAGTCTIVYLWTRDIFNQRIGLITGIIAAFYPGLFIYDGWLYTESLYTFLLLVFAYGLYRLQCTARLRWAGLSGLALAGASLTRPNGLLYLGLVVVWAIVVLWARLLPWKTVVGGVLILAFLTAGLVAPWTVRNYTVSRTFVPVATGSGAVLLGAYNNQSLTDRQFGLPGMWVPPARISPPVNYYGHQPCCTYDLDGYQEAYVEHWISTHPAETAELAGLHFVNMWRPYTPEAGLPVEQFPDRVSSKIVWEAMITTPILVIVLALFGLLVSWRRRWRHLLIPALLVLMDVAQCIVFYGSSRFRAPIEPVLVLMMGGAIWWLAQRVPWIARRRARTATGSEALAQQPVKA
jgi:4-amino-4-deoxy-L-arabinose transferase-like glycosyltransferase